MLRVTAVATTADTHGTVSFDPESGRITYTPEANYHGPASFTYTVDDRNGGTAAATVTVSVAAVNDAPTAVSGTYHVAEDSSVIVDLRQFAGDVETPVGDLVYTIVNQPTRGHLTPVAGQNGVFRYTPGAGANAALDSFAFTATDAGDGADTTVRTSNAATVSLAIDRYADVSRDGGLLRVGLSDANDVVYVDKGVLYVNGSAVSLAGVTEVRVWARGGNDLVSLDGLAVPAQVFASAGNDAVVGGSGSDLLLGGGGHDHLYGLGGNDVLAADDFGPGAMLAQLRQLQSLWADRQSTAGDALAADALFDSDGDADVLAGGSGADWFILGTADQITDLSRAAGNAPNSGDLVTYV
jgi:Ca2+-binding RTX toxin-like protein